MIKFYSRVYKILKIDDRNLPEKWPEKFWGNDISSEIWWSVLDNKKKKLPHIHNIHKVHCINQVLNCSCWQKTHHTQIFVNHTISNRTLNTCKNMLLPRFILQSQCLFQSCFNKITPIYAFMQISIT